MSVKHVKVLLQKGIVVATLIWVLLAGIGPVFGQMGDETIKVDDQDGSLSIDVYEARVSEVFQDLAGKTPYEFVVPEALGNIRVTLKCSRVDLHAAIRRLIGNTGVDNFALIYSHRAAKPEREPQWLLKVVVMEGDVGGTDATFFQPRQVPVPSAMLNSGKVSMEYRPRQPNSFLGKEVPTPVMLPIETGDFLPRQPNPFLGKEVPTPVMLPIETGDFLPRQPNPFLGKEVPTPVMLPIETGDFPAYRILENDQIPEKIQMLSPP